MIIAAAIKDSATGMLFVLPRPARHRDITENLMCNYGIMLMELGFINHLGQYLDRSEAFKDACASNQLDAICMSNAERKLFSEDLW